MLAVQRQVIRKLVDQHSGEEAHIGGRALQYVVRRRIAHLRATLVEVMACFGTSSSEGGAFTPSPASRFNCSLGSMSRRFSDFCPKSWRLNQSSWCLSVSYCECSRASADFASLSAALSSAFSCSSSVICVAGNLKLPLALNTAVIYQLSHRSGSLPVALSLAYNLDIHAFNQRQQRGAIQLTLHLLRSPAKSKLALLQTLAPHPVLARIELQNLYHRAPTIDKDEPLPARRIFPQVPPHSGRQSVKRTPHVRGLGKQPDPRRGKAVQHDACHY